MRKRRRFTQRPTYTVAAHDDGYTEDIGSNSTDVDDDDGDEERVKPLSFPRGTRRIQFPN